MLRATVIIWAILFSEMGGNPGNVAFALPLSLIFVALGDVLQAKRLTGLSVMLWWREIVVPIALLVGICVALGLMPRLIMHQSFIRVVVTGLIEVVAISFLSWFCVLSASERNLVLHAKRRILEKLAFTRG